MNFQDFQEQVSRSLVWVHPEDMQKQLIFNTLGVLTEGAKAVDIIKKHAYHDHPMTDEMREEYAQAMGSAAIHMAAALSLMGLDMESVTEYSLRKGGEK